MSCTATHLLFGAWGETDPVSPPCMNHSHTNPEEGSLQPLARKTSLHGLVHVVNKESSRVQHGLWTFAFIGCLCFFIYHSISRIMYYFQFHHITKLEEKVAPEKTFPGFTFCRLRKSTLTACDIEHLTEIWHIPAEHTENITSPMYEVNRKSFKYLNGTKAEPPCCGQFDWKGYTTVQLTACGTWWSLVALRRAHCTAEDFESVSNFLACLWT